MRGNRYSNVEIFQPGKFKWNHLLLTGQGRSESFIIFMFITNKSILKSIMSLLFQSGQ